MPAERRTVDLNEYPDLVVIYLGMQAKSLRGLRTLLGFGRQIREAVNARPEGLLVHEQLVFSVFPPHLGMRQYWRDFESLESWARSLPHQRWWQTFVRDPGGAGFWHETYLRRGGMESVYLDMSRPVGLAAFARLVPARGAMFSARQRAGVGGESPLAAPITQEELDS